jgi:hypothetical protein
LGTLGRNDATATPFQGLVMKVRTSRVPLSAASSSNSSSTSTATMAPVTAAGNGSDCTAPDACQVVSVTGATQSAGIQQPSSPANAATSTGHGRAWCKSLLLLATTALLVIEFINALGGAL